MTKKMLEDLVKVLRKKTLILSIVLIIVSCLLVGTVIFAFSEFEISNETQYEIEYEADTGDGDNGTISQVNDMSENKDSTVLIICISVVLSLFIICALIGVIYYGKSKNESYKKKESNDKKEE